MATEKRLIDANALIKDWNELTKRMVRDADGKIPVDFGLVIRELSKTPTVEAVVLPCKIGDKVYRIDKGNFRSNWMPFVQELTVTEISWKKEKYGDKDLGFAIIADGIRYKFTSIGKSVFLTRKEAEAKMDGGESK